MGKINLRDYQIKAIENMKNGCILCGGVGSGKSRTSLGYYYICNGGDLNSGCRMVNPKDLYIITTARKRDTLEWESELPLYLLSTDCKDGPYYNKVVIDSWNNIKKYVNVKDAFFIFDEQRVVGKGVWVKSFLKITKSNNWILLSATPGDTWSDYIPVFIANGFYRNRTEFNDEHIIYKPFSSFPIIDSYRNTGRLIRLRNSILVDMEFLRNTVQHNETIWVNYDKFEYKDICRNRWNKWKEKPIETASEYCLCLRRCVNSSDSRQIAVLEIFEKHPKVIIFYNYDYELEILKNLGYGPNVDISEWNGHKHQPVPDSDSWVYLVQYNAGAEGWNCIKTDTVIFYSQNYSYKIMVQSSGRIDRMNTPYIDLYFYHLKSRSGIDLAIDSALKKKKKFNETGFANTIFSK